LASVGKNSTNISSGEGLPTLPVFKRSALLALARTKSTEYRAAEPFPNVVIDDFLPDVILHHLINDFPGPEEVVWRTYDSATEIKLALEDEALIPPIHLEVLRELNSQMFVEFLEELTGISGLIPDPHFRGGGLHQILPGGMLKVHADFDMHPWMGVHRQLNVLLYLNDRWEESYGGSLELWNKTMTAAVSSIAPIANRLVVFSTTDDSYHGHPDPLTCPPGRSRRSMAWYYYTATDTHRDRQGHNTLFQERPGERLTTLKDKLTMRVLTVLPASAKDAAKRVIKH
jgi:hypothetical protein